MEDLLGFIALSIVIIIILLISIFSRPITKILFVALMVRVFFMLYGHYFSPLPDSTGDSTTFEKIAWIMSREGFSKILDNSTGLDIQFISWVIAIPYSLFGRSLLMAQSISLFLGMLNIILAWKVASKLWDRHTAKKATWTIALFPSLILYSVLLMREVYIVFFILIALYGSISLIKTQKIKFFILALSGFAGSILFHGAMIVGAIIFVIYVGLISIKKFFKLFFNFRINIETILLLISFVVISSLYLTNNINVKYLGDFGTTFNIDNIILKTNYATRGDASWPEWTIINSTIDLVYKGPIRSIYFILSPFPWDVTKSSHVIGMLDAFLYLYLSFLIFYNKKIIWKDPALRFILLMLLAYIFVFGIGVGNFGTGIRHRSKFTIMFILLAAPLLKNFKLFQYR